MGSAPDPGAPARPRAPDRGERLRAKLVAGLILGLFAALAARLYQHQVVHADRWRGLAFKQQRPFREVQAYRGDIVSSDGVVLARSVRVRSAFAVPRHMGARGGREPPTPADLDRAARAIAQALGYDAAREAKVRARFADPDGDPRGFCWIERRLDAERAARLAAAKIRGVSFKDEYRREYPAGKLAAHLLGLVSLDDEGELKGISGVEKLFDRELSGVNGLREVVLDARGGSIIDEGAIEVPPEDGATVTLTIDTTLQAALERALARAAHEWKPRGIAATVLDPRDGRILAIASWPTYDPNTLAGLDPETLRFRPLMDTFEPGSIVKPLIVAAALEAGAITTTSTFDCSSPQRFGGRSISDKHPRPGPQSLRSILAYSLNCGMYQIGLRAGPRPLKDALDRAGFGQPTGLGLALEERGTIPAMRNWLARWGHHSTISVAQGYELAVTQLQIASAFAALGNGGVRMRPRLASKIEDPRGLVVARFDPEPAARYVSPEVLRAVILPALGEAVELGTGKRAKLDKWRIGGKTGTAKIQVGRGYAPDRNRSSFVALAPIEAPRLLVAVTVDDPVSKGGDPSGGLVAAPIARDFLAEALPYLRVPPSPRAGAGEGGAARGADGEGD